MAIFPALCSKGTKSALATLVFMVSVCAAIILSEYAKIHDANAAYQKNAERDRRTASEEVAETCQDRLGAAFRSCIFDQLETYYRDQSTNEDLQAQQDMAFWAAAIFVSSSALRATTLFVHGRISYRDVFDEERYTRYRFRLHVDPEGISDTDAFIICDEGNEST